MLENQDENLNLESIRTLEEIEKKEMEKEKWKYKSISWSQTLKHKWITALKRMKK